jgi:hypothetical protein
MNAPFAIARAAFRLKGTLLYLIFAALLAAAALFISAAAPSPNTHKATAMLLGMAAWMGWFVYLPRFWQLQHHAETLQLPAARMRHERATVLFGLLGTMLPALALFATGVPLHWALLAMLLALAAALLHLLTTAAGIAFIAPALLLPITARFFPQLLPLLSAQAFPLLLLGTAVCLVLSLRRWRSSMHVSAEAGWRVPQIVLLSQRDNLGITDQRQDPMRQWMGTQASPLDGRVGPDTPIRSLAVLLCGSMAPLGWCSYLRSTAWMSVATLFLVTLSVAGDEQGKGLGFALPILLSIAAMAIPMTLIMRLRLEWSGSGQGLAEAFLLPGLIHPGFSWPQVMAAMLYTTVYRLSLPAAMVFVALAISTGGLQTGMLTLAIAGWGLLLSLTLLPLAQRQGGLATFLLYLLLGLVVLSLVAVHMIIDHRGLWPIPPIITIASAVILLSAVLGGLFPRSQSPFALSAS